MYKILKNNFSSNSIVSKIIWLTVAIFIVQSILQMIFWAFKRSDLFEALLLWFYLPLSFSNFFPKFYTLITYQFFHEPARIGHIFFNMLSLYFFSPYFLTFQSEKKILPFYLLSGIFAGVVTLLAFEFLPALNGNSTNVLLGASAGVIAVLVAATTFSPNFQMYLFGVFSVKIIYVAMFYILVSIVSMPNDNHGGHIAHLAGALFGFTYVKLLRMGYNLTGWMEKSIDVLITFINRFNRPKSKMRTYYKSEEIYTPPSNNLNKNQDILDSILDKISRSGYDSLSKEEKEFLFKQSQ